MSCLKVGMTRVKAEKFVASPWGFKIKKFPRRFNVDKGIDGSLVETKYYPGFKVDKSKLQRCRYM
jgi:hypothetical protein